MSVIKLVETIKKHKVLTVIFIIGAFVVPLVVIQLLFECDSGIQSKWSAGDALAYVIGFGTFFGTVFLGIVAAYQSEVAQNYTRKISEENLHLQKIMCQML